MNKIDVRKSQGHKPHQYLGNIIVKSKFLQCAYVLWAPPIFGTFQGRKQLPKTGVAKVDLSKSGVGGKIQKNQSFCTAKVNFQQKLGGNCPLHPPRRLCPCFLRPWLETKIAHNCYLTLTYKVDSIPTKENFYSLVDFDATLSILIIKL